MEWGVPQNLIWLWTLAAALGVFLISSRFRLSKMNRFGDAALVARLLDSLDASKRIWKRALILAVLGLMTLALAQPHFRTKEITVERKGIDVMIVVDVSQSMLAKDIAPNRLEKAKLELSTLVDKLKQDRIGIVAFAGEAYIQCPLTLDRSAVKLFLSTLGPAVVPTPGTAIGSAIRVALTAFSDKEKEFKAVILLTDGEDHSSNPLEAAAWAKEMGVRIFTVGIGTAEGSTVPENASGESFKKDRQGQVVFSKLDESLLRKISSTTGGTFYRSSRGEIEVDELVNEIRQMTQKGLKSEKTIEYEESYQWLLGFAFFLLMLEWALSERKGQIV